MNRKQFLISPFALGLAAAATKNPKPLKQKSVTIGELRAYDDKGNVLKVHKIEPVVIRKGDTVEVKWEFRGE